MSDLVVEKDSASEPIVSSDAVCAPPVAPHSHPKPALGVARPRRFSFWNALGFSLSAVFGASLGLLIVPHAPSTPRDEVSNGVPPAETSSYVLSVPVDQPFSAVASLISQSTSEIVVVGDTILSSSLLSACARAHQRGVRVTYVLGRAKGVSPTAQWVQANKAGKVAMANVTLPSHFIIVDSRFLVLSPVGWMQQSFTDMAFPVLFLDHRATAAQYRAFVQDLVVSSL